MQKKGYGVDIQQNAIEAFAEGNGWQVACFYTDEAESGTEENRANLDQLIRDCKRGKIRMVIVSSLCRFARSIRFAENFFYELAQLNVSVCFADLPTYDDTDDKEVMRRQMDEVWAEYDRKRIKSVDFTAEMSIQRATESNQGSAL